jgi:uncharacterized protein (TIGR02271 family)
MAQTGLDAADDRIGCGRIGNHAGRRWGGNAGRIEKLGPRQRNSLSPSDSHEEVIRVAEEELRIGKRDVSHGRVRVRSYVVETPVQEQVGLREEHVRVERRPADRPVSDEENLFRERTVEADERAEEAMIAKQARVKEELVVKKDVGQRTETVSDKVRRTEVEVDDGRSQPDRPNERKRP